MIMILNDLSKKRRAAFWHISMKARFLRLIIYRFVESFNDCIAKRQRNISYPHAEQVFFRICLQIGIRLLRNMIKQVGFFQVGIMHVWSNHSTSPSKTVSAGPLIVTEWSFVI